MLVRPLGPTSTIYMRISFSTYCSHMSKSAAQGGLWADVPIGIYTAKAANITIHIHRFHQGTLSTIHTWKPNIESQKHINLLFTGPDLNGHYTPLLPLSQGPMQDPNAFKSAPAPLHRPQRGATTEPSLEALHITALTIMCEGGNDELVFSEMQFMFPQASASLLRSCMHRMRSHIQVTGPDQRPLTLLRAGIILEAVNNDNATTPNPPAIIQQPKNKSGRTPLNGSKRGPEPMQTPKTRQGGPRKATQIVPLAIEIPDKENPNTTASCNSLDATSLQQSEKKDETQYLEETWLERPRITIEPESHGNIRIAPEPSRISENPNIPRHERAPTKQSLANKMACAASKYFYRLLGKQPTPNGDASPVTHHQGPRKSRCEKTRLGPNKTKCMDGKSRAKEVRSARTQKTLGVTWSKKTPKLNPPQISLSREDDLSHFHTAATTTKTPISPISEDLPQPSTLRALTANVMGILCHEDIIIAMLNSTKPALFTLTETHTVHGMHHNSTGQRLRDRTFSGYRVHFSSSPPSTPHKTTGKHGNKSIDHRRRGRGGIIMGISSEIAGPGTFTHINNPQTAALNGYLLHSTLRRTHPTLRGSLNIIGVYMPEDMEKRKLIYAYIRHVIDRCNNSGEDLLVNGDFNAVLYQEDRNGPLDAADKLHLKECTALNLQPMGGVYPKRPHTFFRAQDPKAPPYSSRIDDILLWTHGPNTNATNSMPEEIFETGGTIEPS